MTNVSFPHGPYVGLCVKWFKKKKKKSVYMTTELYNWNKSSNTFLRRGLLYRNLFSVLLSLFLPSALWYCWLVIPFVVPTLPHITDHTQQIFRNRGITMCQLPLWGTFTNNTIFSIHCVSCPFLTDIQAEN